MNPDGLQWEEAGSQLPIDWSIAQLRERGFACTYYFEGEPRSRIMTVARGLSGAALIAAAVLATTASTAPPNLATTLGRCLVLLCGVLLLASALHGSLAFVRRREFRRSRNKAAELRAASPTAMTVAALESVDLPGVAAKFATSGRFSPIEVTLATQRMLLIGRSEALVLEAAELRVVGEALHPSASVSIGIGDVVWVHGGHRERGPLPTWAIVHPKSYRSSDIDWLLGTNEDPITLGVEPEVVDRVSTNNDCLRPSGASDRTDLCETRTSGAKRATFAEAWAALEDLDIQPVTSNVFEEILHVAFAVVGVAFISSYLLSATMPIVALHVGLTALTIAAAIHLIGLRSRFQRRSIERESPWTIASVKEPDLPAILARMDRGPNRHFGCEVTYLAQPMICTRETETIAITDWSNIVLIPTRAPARTLRIDVGDRIWIRGGQRKRRPDPEWLGTSAHAQQSVPHVLSPPTDGALRLRTTVKLVPRADGP